MTTILQAAFIFAALSVAALALCLIPVALQARRKLEKLSRAGEELTANVEALLRDSRDMVRNVTELSIRARSQMDDADHMMRMVRLWMDRADRLVDGVGAIVEPPLYSLARTALLIRTGFGAFMQAFKKCE